MEEVGQDLDAAIYELMKTQDKDNKNKDSNQWPDITAKDLRKAIKTHISEGKKTSSNTKDIEMITDDNYRDAIIEKIKNEADKSDSPETIDIERPGKYKIDLKGLLEEEPIIIQKDGSYIIHLPSVFKMIDKPK